MTDKTDICSDCRDKIKDLLDIQVSVIVNGATKSKLKRAEKIAKELGFKDDELETLIKM